MMFFYLDRSECGGRHRVLDNLVMSDDFFEDVRSSPMPFLAYLVLHSEGDI